MTMLILLRVIRYSTRLTPIRIGRLNHFSTQTSNSTKSVTSNVSSLTSSTNATRNTIAAPSRRIPPRTPLTQDSIGTQVWGVTKRASGVAMRFTYSFLTSPSTKAFAKTAMQKAWELTKATGRVTWEFIKYPPIVKQWAMNGWIAIKEGAHHTWTGFKLLFLETQTSFKLVSKRLQGHQLTRRERQQLIRTTADLSRMVPFMVFIIVPFMELLLPIALKVFPNMLPSTFQDQYKREEDMKRQLKLRIEMATFLQDIVVEMEDKVKARVKNSPNETISVEDVHLFMEKTRIGARIEDETLLKVAKLFSDELTTDNMSRSQLVTLCKYMGLQTLGGDSFLRFQLRTKLNSIREDDAQIYFEGVESLNLLELKQACQERGMRATGLSMHQYRKQLQRWVELSVRKEIPLSLLILSRAFTLNSMLESNEVEIQASISEALSKMDENVLQTALLEGALSKDINTDRATLSKYKLEAILKQNELIESEIREKERKRAFLEKLRHQAQQELAIASGKPVPEASSKVRMTPIGQVPTAPTEETMAPGHQEASGVPVKEKPKDDATKVIAQKLESLRVLASKDPLGEEKSVLETLVERQEEYVAASAVESGRIVKEDAGVGVASEGLSVAEKRIQSMLQKKISSMVEKLEVDVQATDEKIREKFKALDLDNDGTITVTELRTVLVSALKNSGVKEEDINKQADKLVESIDMDRDGVISVGEMDLILQRLRVERKLAEGE